MKKKVNYSEGDLFMIETENSNKFLGLITNRKGRTKSLIGYFWKYDSEDMSKISNDDNVLLATRFSGLGFEMGSWEIIGKYPNWNKGDWAIQEFKKFDELRGVYYAVRYDEFDYVSQRRITSKEADNLFPDGTHGYISLENYLQRNFSRE